MPPELETAVVEPPAMQNAPSTRGWSRFRAAPGYLFSAVLTVACVAGLVTLGQATGWKLPKGSTLWGEQAAAADRSCRPAIIESPWK